MLPAGRIVMTASLPLVNGISYIPVLPCLIYDGPNGFPPLGYKITVGWDCVGGTHLVGDGTFPAFSCNDAGQAHAPTPASPQAVSNVYVGNMCLENFSRGISAGSQNTMGVQNSVFENLFITGCTDWGIWFVNFMHCQFNMIRLQQCGDATGVGNNGHAYFASWLPRSILAPGNSLATDIIYFPGAGDMLRRGIVVEAKTNDTNVSTFGQLNEFNMTKIQGVPFNRSSFTQTATITGAPAGVITVTDGTKFCVGMPFWFPNATLGNLTQSTTYFVLSVTGNVLTIGADLSPINVITPSTNGTILIDCGGMPEIEVAGIQQAGDSQTSTISSFFLDRVDVEALSSAALCFLNTSACYVQVDEFPSGSTRPDVVLRGSNSMHIHMNVGGNMDIASDSAQSTVGGRVGTIYNRTPGGNVYDQTLGAGRFAVVNNSLTGNSANFVTHNVSGGSVLRLFGKALGYYLTPASNTASVSLNAGRTGINTCSASTATTRILPTITNASSISTFLGMPFTQVNAGTGTIAFQTDGTQTFGFSTKQAATMTNLSMNIVVTNAAAYQVNMLVTVDATANGFTAGTQYYVVSTDLATTIQLSATLGGTAIIASGNTATNVTKTQFNINPGGSVSVVACAEAGGGLFWAILSVRNSN